MRPGFSLHTLCVAISFLAAIILSPIATAEDRAPSFLFIAVDDWNVYNTVLGDVPESFLHKVYPDEDLRTDVIRRLSPNLDKLASMGLTFDQAYTTFPLCGPARTALLTGVPAYVSGYLNHEKHFRHFESLTNTVTLPQYLKKNGYFTTGVGKIFHKPRSYLDRGTFSDWPDQLYSWSHWIETGAGTGRAHGSTVSFSESNSPYWDQRDLSVNHYTRFGKTNLPVSASHDYVNATHAANLILHRESTLVDVFGDTHRVTIPQNQPYFVACGLFAPHLPWIARQEYYDLFPQEEMAIDRDLLTWVLDDLDDLSPSGRRATSQTGFSRLREHGLKIEPDGGDIEAWRTYVQAYLATIAFADACLAPLVEAIENNPERDNTIIFLWSDHGYHVGDKNREGKTTLWEAANRINLIVIDPRHESASSGKQTEALVSLQDLYPTITAMASLERPAHVHGYDLAPVLANPDHPWKPEVLNTYRPDSYALRTHDWRYIRYGNGDMELYDLNADPLEQTNLFHDPGQAERLAAFSDRLDQVLARTPSNYQ